MLSRQLLVTVSEPFFQATVIVIHQQSTTSQIRRMRCVRAAMLSRVPDVAGGTTEIARNHFFSSDRKQCD